MDRKRLLKSWNDGGEDLNHQKSAKARGQSNKPEEGKRREAHRSERKAETGFAEARRTKGPERATVKIAEGQESSRKLQEGSVEKGQRRENMNGSA
jgi:hypothetical protein